MKTGRNRPMHTCTLAQVHRASSCLCEIMNALPSSLLASLKETGVANSTMLPYAVLLHTTKSGDDDRIIFKYQEWKNLSLWQGATAQLTRP